MRDSAGDVSHFFSNIINIKDGPVMDICLVSNRQNDFLIFSFHHALMDHKGLVALIRSIDQKTDGSLYPGREKLTLWQAIRGYALSADFAFSHATGRMVSSPKISGQVVQKVLQD